MSLKIITQTDIEAAASLFGERYSTTDLLEWMRGFQMGANWGVYEKERRDLIVKNTEDEFQRDRERVLDL